MPKATVVITADNQLKKGIDPAKKTMLEFQNIVSGIEKKISKAFTITGIATAAVAGFRLITKAASECVQCFEEADKVSRRLIAVWDNVGKASGKSAKQVDDLAEALEKETYFTSESIKEAGLLLAATESLTEEGFDRALNASMDLAAALGEDVTSAAQTLAKAIQEPESSLSRLKSIGVSFTEDEKAQIKALAEANQEYEAQSIILDKIEQKYKGVAKAIADTPTGKLDAIRDTWGDIKETLGQGIVEALDPAFTFILNMLQSIHKWAQDHMDQNKFWKNADKGNSHLLYQNYSQDFLTERQTEALADVAEELQMLRSDKWGQILEENFDMALEDILLLDRNYVSNQMKKDASIIFGENYEDFIGTAEGFFERVVDQYDPLVGVLETINGALEEYADLIPDKPSASIISGSKESTETTTESALASFLGKYGSQSESYQIRQLNESIALAESIRDSLESASTAERVQMLKEAGISASPNQTLGWLNQIIDSMNSKLDGLTALPEILDNPTLTDLDSILDTYGKNSVSYQKEVLNAEYNRIAEAYEYASDEQKVYLKEILAENEKQREALEELPEVLEKSFLDKFSGKLASLFEQAGLGNSTQAAMAAGQAVSDLTSSFGEAGEVVSTLAQNMLSMGPVLGAIVTALKYVFEGMAETFGPILNEFVKYGIEPLKELGRVIGDMLKPLLEAVMPLVKDSAESLMSVFHGIATALMPIINLIVNIVTPIFDQLANTLKFIEPIVEAIALVLASVNGVLSYVGQAIMHFVAVFLNWIAGLNLFGWKPFEGLAINDPGSPGNFSTYMDNIYTGVHESFDKTYAGNTNADQQAIASASYRGATNVTINIYAEGPFVGDNGMRQFAQMIKEEFDALDYYGVSA